MLLRKDLEQVLFAAGHIRQREQVKLQKLQLIKSLIQIFIFSKLALLRAGLAKIQACVLDCPATITLT